MSVAVRRIFAIASFLTSAGVSALCASAQQSDFQHLVRPKFTALRQIDGISADGLRVVATFATSPEGIDRPVAWDAAGTGKILGLLPEPSHAGTYVAQFRQPISADGSLIGGYCQSFDEPSGFWGSPPVSWDASGAIRQLESPFVGGSVSYSGWVSAVSPNGAYIYGYCQVPSGNLRPYRWNAAGEATMLQTLSGEDSAGWHHMSATSTDGTIAVGTDNTAPLADGSVNYRPVRWHADGSVEPLRGMGTDADGHAHGQADLCSGDGSVVVGWLEKYSSGGAYLKTVNVCWIGDERPIELPGVHLAMTPSGKTIVGDARFDLVDGKIVRTELGKTSFGVIYAQDVSDDARIMAGGGSPRSSHPGAIVWIYGRMHMLEDLLAARGVTLAEGWKSLDWIYFCSADGTVFVGEGTFGTKRTVFRATIPDILVDKEKPVFETLATIRRTCDPGKPFATVNLKTPKATDNFPSKVVVTTTTTGSRFPIGTTNVVWKAKDKAGNVARKTQKVIVTARPSNANDSALRGIAFAEVAADFGYAAGEFSRVEDGQTNADALFAHAALRTLQQAYSSAAATELLTAYAETGDEDLLAACGHAAYGTAYAGADRTER